MPGAFATRSPLRESIAFPVESAFNEGKLSESVHLYQNRPVARSVGQGEDTDLKFDLDLRVLDRRVATVTKIIERLE